MVNLALKILTSNFESSSCFDVLEKQIQRLTISVDDNVTINYGVELVCPEMAAEYS